MKSRANLERRQRSLEERLDPSWQPQCEEPVLEGGSVLYEVAGRTQAIGSGGLGMLQCVVESSGLGESIDQRVQVLRRHLPYSESDHVLSQVYMLLTGGRCLEDLEARRCDEGFLDALGARRLPDPTTAGDFLRRFGEREIEALMEAANRARSNVWHTRPKSERRLAKIDVDGTIVETLGECKEGMDVSYDGRWGFVPLVVSLANTQEVLYVVNRPANRPSHDGAAVWMDRAVDCAQRCGFERARLRGDTDFSLTANFDRWTENGVEFVFGIDAHPSFVKRAKSLASEAWKPMRRTPKKRPKRRPAPRVKPALVESRGFRDLHLVEEHVAEVDYRPKKARRTYRMVILRKRIKVRQGQLRLADEIRYFFYVTNIDAKLLGPAGVVRENNARCHQENLIEQLKNGVHALRMPSRELNANWTYLAIGAIAWNLKAWAALLLPAEHGARALLKMEMRRFLNEVILIPAQILRSGRRLVFRLLAINRWVPLLMDGTASLRRHRYG